MRALRRVPSCSPALLAPPLLALSLTACGARTGLATGAGSDAGAPEAPDCYEALDCVQPEDRCQTAVCTAGKCEPGPAVTCDDGDACTEDACASPSGKCVHTPLTPDVDGDGHREPLAGHQAGDPGSCGDDCNDANAAAHPGGTETCDGVDNDCNGVVDDGARFTPSGADAILVSDATSPVQPAGIAWSGGAYLAGYTGQNAGGKNAVYTARLAADGSRLAPPDAFTHIEADAMGGAVAWTGDRFGIAWEDRRDGDYEVYFNELGPDGAKLGPDVRITDAVGFSIAPSLAWTGREFVVVWQDDRFGAFGVWAQRVNLDRQLVGDNVLLSDDDGTDHESPVVAAGVTGIGVVWNEGFVGFEQVAFGAFDASLSPLAPSERLTAPGQQGAYGTLAWNRTEFVVAWYDPDLASQHVVGAVVGEKGDLRAGPIPLTESPRHSRYPALLPLGDRVLLVWSDDKDANAGYELYSKMLDAKLVPLTAESRITQAAGDSVFPYAGFGPNGDVGVLFRDDRSGSPLGYFARLVCVAGN